MDGLVRGIRIRKWTIFSAFSAQEGTVVWINAGQHGLNRLHCISLVVDISFKIIPILQTLLLDVIKDDFLIDRVRDLAELFDGIVVAAQIGQISCLFQIVAHLFHFTLHYYIVI